MRLHLREGNERKETEGEGRRQQQSMKPGMEQSLGTVRTGVHVVVALSSGSVAGRKKSRLWLHSGSQRDRV